jgi:hypothetical protein
LLVSLVFVILPFGVFFFNLASVLQALLLKQNIDFALLVYKTWGWDTIHTNLCFLWLVSYVGYHVLLSH